jgi:hypothetical protein
MDSKMNNEEVLKTYEKLQQVFGDRLPDFEVYPKQFAYFVKLYRFYYESK